MDEEIRARIAAKRYTEAFELALEQYQHKVFRLACSMLGNRALAEETAQEIFVRVWRALPGFRGESSVSTWIFTITRNTCLTALKNESTRRTMPLGEREGQTLRASAREESRGPDLPHLVSQLPEKYRRVITLFYMEEKSYDEVARMLDLPIGTVKTYLHRAKKELAAAVMESKITRGER